MKLYNTLTRQIEFFKPIKNQSVRLYSCGPTVYDHAHIGNLSAFVFADTLRRALQATGYQVTHGMNYTDVDDKTIRRSRERYPDEDPNIRLHKLTTEYIQLFLEDMGRIGNNVEALTFLRATDEAVLEGMRRLITRLHQEGFAYIADDGVYFSIDAYRRSGKQYGQLLELNAENTGTARIQNDEYDKESVHDFALWKKQRPDEPAWEFNLDGHDLSGRPGWHIECSVMSRQLLGQPFDIHTGGVDLIFPHHENEIAQSTAGEANPVMAQFFAHNEHILVDGKKMSKSANNFYTLQDIMERGYDPLAFRLLVLQSHYRNQAHFSWENLEAAQNRLKSLQALADLVWQMAERTKVASELEAVKQDIYEALIDDLNTPQALTVLSDAEAKWLHLLSSEDTRSFREFLDFIDATLGLSLGNRPDLTNEQYGLLNQRDAARRNQDWAKSDALREQLADQGVGLRDTPESSIWFRL